MVVDEDNGIIQCLQSGSHSQFAEAWKAVDPDERCTHGRDPHTEEEEEDKRSGSDEKGRGVYDCVFVLVNHTKYT